MVVIETRMNITDRIISPRKGSRISHRRRVVSPRNKNNGNSNSNNSTVSPRNISPDDLQMNSIIYDEKLRENESPVKKNKRNKSPLPEYQDRILEDLNNVIVNEKLGEGDFGAVYKGSYINKVVAVKMICVENEKALDDDEYNEFLTEGKIMLEMKKHPNLIRVEWICINRNCPAILMEFAPMGTLREHLNSLKEDLSKKVILSIVRGTARGLSVLHSTGVVHRDIAARNILLGEGLVPKVSDFGLSRECQKEGAYNSRGLHALPVKWMSPESIQGKFSTQTDIWSFGVVIWEIITRDLPHKDLDTTECKIMIRDNHLTPAVPQSYENTPIHDLLKQCWYSDLEMRISAKDIVEFIDDL